MIRITSDLHTHTRHSHGTGSMEDNIRAAIDKGLLGIAISDHGFSHIFYGIPKIEKYLDEIGEMKEKYKDSIKVFSNVELNLMSLDGALDMPSGYGDKFDYRMFGYHKMANYKGWTNVRHFHLRRMREKYFDANTRAYIRAIKQNRVDIITHPGYGMPINKVAVAKAAAKAGTALEINNKHPEFSVEELRQCAWTGVKFVIGSDAHRPEDVGNFEVALSRAQQAGITAAQIINAVDE